MGWATVKVDSPSAAVTVSRWNASNTGASASASGTATGSALPSRSGADRSSAHGTQMSW